MAFDYKKEYKEFYMPPRKPSIVNVPEMHFIAVRGKGDPNREGSEYKAAMSLLYGIAFTIKMSKMGDHRIKGYFDYVVPPLEGFWWQEGVRGIDYSRKDAFQWISLIRLPDFVTKKEFDWAVAEATRKKKTDYSKVEYLTYHEGLCVQCMHIGPYDNEPATIQAMTEFAIKEGYEIDISDSRFHHEIYLSDARKVSPEKLKTVIRHPIRKKAKQDGSFRDIWEKLYREARRVQGNRVISPFIEAGGVAAALLTKAGNIYVGVCIDTACTLGMCAERNAIANMITNGESQIEKLVAIMPDGTVGSPCGACREYMMQLDKNSGSIEILMDYDTRKTVTLKELIPAWWGEERYQEEDYG